MIPFSIKGYRAWSRWLVAVCLSVLVLGCDSIKVTRYYESGVVATTSPIASEVGRRVFVGGGNAFDVAVAVGFTLAVVYPQAENLGGGGFALIHEGETGRVRSLDFRETAPRAATEPMYLDEDGEVTTGLSTYGARACAVPGSVAGLRKLWEKRGALSWDYLVGIAAKLADTGFLIDEYLAEALASYSDQLQGFPETADIFFPNGRLLKAGDRLIQKDLAATLQAIAEKGPDAFYRGEIAALIDSCMIRHDGLITCADLEDYAPVWRETVHFKYGSLDIYSMPPPSSGGIMMGQILKILEPYNFSLFTPESPEYIHLFCEAARLAFADRSAHLGDPDYFEIPSGLLEESYLAERRKMIVERRAGSSEQIQPGNPGHHESEQTTHYSICDSSGNMVAVTTTINSTFGCKLVVAGAGFLLNNEMDDFSIKPGFPNLYGLVGGEVNKIEPGKRMLSSMAPTLILKDEKPFLITGSPGGSRIITTVAQSILNYTQLGLTLAETVAQPRFHHQWLPDMIYLEEGKFHISTKQALIRYGHNIRERPPFGDLQMIAVDPSGLMEGASDPRHGGAVSGY